MGTPAWDVNPRTAAGAQAAQIVTWAFGDPAGRAAGAAAKLEALAAGADSHQAWVEVGDAARVVAKLGAGP